MSPSTCNSGSGTPPSGTSAIRFPAGSSNSLSGTRKIAPIDARTAFGPAGSAQPSESAMPAPNASAARSSVPTLPGSPTRQSASVTALVPRGRSAFRKTATTRGGCPSVDTSASNSGSNVLACDENVRGLEAGIEPGLDEVLALDREQPELVAPAPVVELADELEPLVVARRDQAG